MYNNGSQINSRKKYKEKKISMKEKIDVEKAIVHEIIGHEDSEDVFTKGVEETPSLAELVVDAIKGHDKDEE